MFAPSSSGSIFSYLCMLQGSARWPCAPPSAERSGRRRLGGQRAHAGSSQVGVLLPSAFCALLLNAARLVLLAARFSLVSHSCQLTHDSPLRLSLPQPAAAAAAADVPGLAAARPLCSVC